MSPLTKKPAHVRAVKPVNAGPATRPSTSAGKGLDDAGTSERVGAGHFAEHFSNQSAATAAGGSETSHAFAVEKKLVEDVGIVAASTRADVFGEMVFATDNGDNAAKVLTAMGVKARLMASAEKMLDAVVSVSASGLDNEDASERTTKSKKRKTAPQAASAHLSPLQTTMLPVFNAYADVMLATQSRANEKDLRLTYCLHAVNHVLKTRDRVLKNTARINAMNVASAAAAAASKDGKDVEHTSKGEIQDEEQNQIAAADSDDENGDADVQRDGITVEYRDQGFTRPKVLILLPLKNIAFDVIETIIKLSGASQIENKSRFMTEFTLPPEEDSLDPSKPEDYQHDFRGNIDDMFRIGIKFSRRHMKLFSDFYSADVIVASPLGLRMVVGAEGDKERDFDFLSSIEVIIVDRCDMLLMQNWEHVQHIFNHLNLTPKSAHDCDFARIKNWYLDGRAPLLRQSVILSQFIAPEMNALMTKLCKNIDGRVKVTEQYQGSVGEVIVQIPQMFHRIACPSLKDIDDTRFQHFVNKVVPTLKRSGMDQKGTLIFIPSYFDYVRVRNYFRERHSDLEVGELCEYTSNSDISRARGAFFHGKIPILLMTERFHFFRRYKIRGCKHLVFYQLPEYARFYSELLNTIDVGMDSSCSAVYSVYDRFRMERVVGTDRISKMMEKETFMFA